MALGKSSSGHVKRIKNMGYFANQVLMLTVAILLLAAIVYWIYEEIVFKEYYAVNIFLDLDPKFREARIILLVGYLMTLAFLSMIQCCIQISKEPHNQHVGPRRVVWCLSATLTILIFIAAAALAAVFKSDSLLILEDHMTHNITQENFYANFSQGEFSDTGMSFNKIQSQFECCGVHGRDDYTNFQSKYNTSVPYSCCKLKDGSMAGSDVITGGDVIDEEACQQTNNSDAGFSNGCYPILHKGITQLCQEVVILGAVAAGIIFVATFLRLVLGYYYQKHKEQREYESVQAISMNKRADGSNDQIASI